jgi:hypothetical protein
VDLGQRCRIEGRHYDEQQARIKANQRGEWAAVANIEDIRNGWNSVSKHVWTVGTVNEKERSMGQTKQTLDQFSVYIPKRKIGDRIVERIITLGDRRERSLNFLCVQAIEEYLARQEAA